MVQSVLAERQTRLQVDGKFFLRDGKRLSINAVTYGPFPDPQPTSEKYLADLKEMVKSGFNAIRVYEEPSRELLDTAYTQGIMVFAGVSWQWDRVFRGFGCEAFFTEAKLKLEQCLRRCADHPAMVGFYVANEIRTEIARWIGPEKTKASIEELIDLVHEVAPQLLAAYSNYPTSEYLEPANADFTGFNIYLEDRDAFAAYMARLHHIAGDRPVLLSEYGLDTKRNCDEAQAEILKWSRQEAINAGIAGTTVFAWSDNWRIGTRIEHDWNFGLTRRDGSAKPALESLSEINHKGPSDFPLPFISIIICVYNGHDRISRAIESVIPVNYPADRFELIVVDDGSSDNTVEQVKKYIRFFPQLKLIEARHGGLSNARNLGAKNAQGEIFAYTDDDCEIDQDWLYWIARGYYEQDVQAMGGPNIPPRPDSEDEAIVAAALGAPSHVMISDRDAEHIPGCNLTVRREAFEAIGGFSKVYRVAGDDVDFCWRLEDAGYKIGFHGAAYVWHRRRTSFLTYFKQQKGYGKAEALLMRDHPHRFKKGCGASWKGCVYTGASLGAHDGSFIYSGPAGSGAFQQVTTHMMPLRELHPLFATQSAKRKLALANYLQPKIRSLARWYYSRKWSELVQKSTQEAPTLKEDPLPQKISETTRSTTNPSAREEIIAAYLTQGWQEEHGYSSWDLKKGKQKLLIIQEITGVEQWQIRERVLS